VDWMLSMHKNIIIIVWFGACMSLVLDLKCFM